MNLTVLIIAGVLALAVLAGVAIAAVRAGLLGGSPDAVAAGPAEFLVESRPYFFSVAENKFYGELVAVAGELELLVFPKVGLNDVFKDKPGAARSQYNRYAQMHVDFLLVTRKDYRPVAGIELDGASHQGERQQARDQKKAAAFKAAGLPLLRFLNHTTVGRAELCQKLESLSLKTPTGA